MKFLVTGGAGFIGTNLVSRLLRHGHTITIFDNLSRKGTPRNLEWLQSLEGASDRLKFILGDTRDARDVAVAVAAERPEGIFHFAAQVAVTTSVVDPQTDFEVNARGTLNVLEAARASSSSPFVVFTSTNKVYGGMEDVKIAEFPTRYAYADPAYRLGVDERRPLDFHSPYGCSKGAADQYVRDYHRIYSMRTTVFRMSCIYGPHQFGNEDQGWVAHFIISAVLGLPLTIYGDGKQVRDVLYVEDLCRAFESVAANSERAAGHVYNVGGGPRNILSVWSEFGPMLQELTGQAIQPSWDGWRPGDQLVYVSDTHRIQSELGWNPRVTVRDGVHRLYRWVVDNQTSVADTLGVALVHAGV